jgi:AcrR family transcriptional regulator
MVAQRNGKDGASARERLLSAAYELFATQGINQVGIDTILVKSGCAKASLYSNFKSKLDLAIAFLDRREQIWTRTWLEAEIKRRATDPVDRLLAIFDVFDGWFRSEDSRAARSSTYCSKQASAARCAGRRPSIFRKFGRSSSAWRKLPALSTRRYLRKPGTC